MYRFFGGLSMVKSIQRDNRGKAFIIILLIFVLATAGFSVYYLFNDNSEPIATTQNSEWEKEVTSAFTPSIYATPSKPDITIVETEGQNPETSAPYPLYLFNNEPYDKTKHQQIFANSLTTRQNTIQSVNEIVESILVPGKSSQKFIDSFPQDAYAQLTIQDIPTEAHKKNFNNVKITSKYINLNLLSDNTVHVTITISGTMTYKNQPAEFQYVLEFTSSDGTIEKITHITDNGFAILFSDMGSKLIGDIKP